MADETLHDKLAKASAGVGTFYGHSTLIRLGLQVAGAASAAAASGSNLALALTAAPALAAILDHVFVSGPARVEQQRVKLLLVGLMHDLENVERDKVDRDYFNSVEFAELVEDAIDSSKRNRDSARIRFNARVLSGAIQLNSRRTEFGEDPKLFLSLLDQLDPEDVRVLRAFYATQRGGPPEGQGEFEWALEHTHKTILEDHLKGMRPDDFEFRRLRLQGLGLIRTVTPQQAISGGFYAYVLTNVVHRTAAWLDRFGGFPTDADIERARNDAAAL